MKDWGLGSLIKSSFARERHELVHSPDMPVQSGPLNPASASEEVGFKWQCDHLSPIQRGFAV